MLYRWQHVQVSRDFVPKVHFAYLKLRSYSELEIYHAQCIIKLLSAFIQFQVVLIFVMPLCWITVITDYHFLSQSNEKESLLQNLAHFFNINAAFKEKFDSSLNTSNIFTFYNSCCISWHCKNSVLHLKNITYSVYMFKGFPLTCYLKN